MIRSFEDFQLDNSDVVGFDELSGDNSEHRDSASKNHSYDFSSRKLSSSGNDTDAYYEDEDFEEETEDLKPLSFQNKEYERDSLELGSIQSDKSKYTQQDETITNQDERSITRSDSKVSSSSVHLSVRDEQPTTYQNDKNLGNSPTDRESEKTHLNIISVDNRNTVSKRVMAVSKHKSFTIQSQTTSALSHFSSIKKIDDPSKLKVLPEHRSSSSQPANVDARNREHVGEMLKYLIQTAAKQIVKSEVEQSILKDVSIPLASIRQGLERKDVDQIDLNVKEVEDNIIIENTYPEYSNVVEVIRQLYDNTQDHHDQTLKPRKKYDESKHVLSEIPAPKNHETPNAVIKENASPIGMKSVRLPSVGAENNVLNTESMEDEYAKMCVDRPDIATHCEKYFATFLSNLIDICKSTQIESDLTPIEKMAMSKVLIEYVHKSFVSSYRLKEIRYDMVKAAYITSDKSKSKNLKKL